MGVVSLVDVGGVIPNLALVNYHRLKAKARKRPR